MVVEDIYTIDHFTVVCSVTWPLNGSEAGGDLVLIQTSPLLLSKSNCYNANYILLHVKRRERSVSNQDQLQSRCHSKVRSPS